MMPFFGRERMYAGYGRFWSASSAIHFAFGQQKTLAEEEKILVLQAALDRKKKLLEVELQKHDIEIQKLQVEIENIRKDHRIIMAENLPAMLQNLKIERLDLGGTTLDTLLENIKNVFEK